MKFKKLDPKVTVMPRDNLFRNIYARNIKRMKPSERKTFLEEQCHTSLDVNPDPVKIEGCVEPLLAELRIDFEELPYKLYINGNEFKISEQDLFGFKKLIKSVDWVKGYRKAILEDPDSNLSDNEWLVKHGWVK